MAAGVQQIKKPVEGRIHLSELYYQTIFCIYIASLRNLYKNVVVNELADVHFLGEQSQRGRLYCIVLYLNTCYSAPTRFPIQRRSRLLL